MSAKRLSQPIALDLTIVNRGKLRKFRVTLIPKWQVSGKREFWVAKHFKELAQ